MPTAHADVSVPFPPAMSCPIASSTDGDTEPSLQSDRLRSSQFHLRDQALANNLALRSTTVRGFSALLTLSR